MTMLYFSGLIEPSYVVSTLNDSVICPHSSIRPTEDGDKKNKPTDGGSEPKHDSNITLVGDRNNITGMNHSTGTDSPSDDTTDFNTSTIPGVVNCTNDGDSPFVCNHHSYIVIVLHNYPVLYGFLALMGVVLVTLSVFLFCVCCSRRSVGCPLGGHRKRPLGRYKPCGQFYKGGSDGITMGIAIPELGVPKTVPSEREKLLIESDEDDL